MRIRRRPWAKQELEEAKFYIDDPSINKDKWKESFENKKAPIYLEIGCGKGSFIAELASSHTEINYIAADMIEAMLGLSKRNIETIYKEKGLEINNLLLIRMNAERILDIFSSKDEIDRIYINFCNPWPRGKHKKRRLTHTRQLENYKQFLNKEKGEIYFKTDDDELFNESLEYFKESNFKIVKKTYDLYNDMIFEDIRTEHEEMFSSQGIKIKALIAKIN
ncbi:MAG: tRNA (guanosine(46)-N7)-methyltransferase TrmB [Clostridia bacterium]|nr:tRNA (guanosine(46)-N7)-methyltransferase TrmB [Clostridia bacterium]